MSETVRALDADASRALAPGVEHYRAFVGPPAEYDLMGATQFRLLTALGLRETHYVLDYGCGSLRAGKLLIPYLDQGRYFGWDPNPWLAEDVIARELGAQLLALKAVTLRHDPALECRSLGREFNYIIAQSIYSHMGLAPMKASLADIAGVLAPRGLLLATFVASEFCVHGGDVSGWVYPECVRYSWRDIEGALAPAGLVGRMLPWRHPRQVWFAAARSLEDLPPESFDAHLTGRVWGEEAYDAPAISA